MSLLDAHPSELKRHVELMREATPAQRFAAVRSLSATVAELSRRELGRRKPGASEAEIDLAFIALHYGDAVAGRLPALADTGSASKPDLLAALEPAIDALNRLGIRYQVGGSVASSVHGMARASMDVDVAAEIEPARVGELVRSLRNDYFVDEGVVRSAVADGAAFNLIHRATTLKIDVFPPRQRPYDRQALARNIDDPLVEGAAATRINVAAAEDIILAKLEWFRLENEAPERQWADVLGVLRVQGDRLDADYLARWAAELDVDDLLSKARAEAAG